MVIVLTVGVLVIGVSLAFIWWLSARAPEGYEDQTGFHQTAESEFALKADGASNPATLKTHDDHAPIAA